MGGQCGRSLSPREMVCCGKYALMREHCWIFGGRVDQLWCCLWMRGGGAFPVSPVGLISREYSSSRNWLWYRQ